MRRRILSCVVALALVSASGLALWAQEPQTPVAAPGTATEAQEADFMTLAKAREAVDLTLRRAHDFEAESNNAWRSLADLGQTAHDQTMANLDRQINEEDRKDDAVKDVQKLDALHAEHDKLDAEWRHVSEVIRPKIEERWQAAFNRLHAAQDAFDALSNCEHSCKDAGLSVILLAHVFDGFAKLTTDLRAEVKKMLGEFDQQQQAWEKLAAAALQPAAPQ
jgi:hypothetical protein